MLAASFPNCSITISNYSGAPIPRIPNLTTMSAKVNLVNPLMHFQPVLLRAPRLRSLDLATETSLGSRTSRPHAYLHYDSRASASRADYSPLETLVLRHIQWTEMGARECLQKMRWSHLRRLEFQVDPCNAIPFLQACCSMPATLSALEDFKLVMWDVPHNSRAGYADVLNGFLSSLPNGLQSLHLEGPWKPSIPTLARYHGQSLRSLVIHEHERVRQSTRRLKVLCVPDLVELAARCKALEHLGLDADLDTHFGFFLTESPAVDSEKVGQEKS